MSAEDLLQVRQTDYIWQYVSYQAKNPLVSQTSKLIAWCIHCNLGNMDKIHRENGHETYRDREKWSFDSNGLEQQLNTSLKNGTIKFHCIIQYHYENLL